MRTPRIGILGGMGPAATILLQQRVLDAVEAASDADHIALLIDMNPQVPSRIDYLMHKRGSNPGPILAHMARRIEGSDVDAIAMPCCTAHHFAADITGAISIPFLNMINLCAAAVASQLSAQSTIGILASPANIRTGLFDKALQSRGLRAVFPDRTNDLLSAIEKIKAEGPQDREIRCVQAIMNEMSANGTDGFIIGCTEFSLIGGYLQAPVPIFDALDALVAEIVRVGSGFSEMGCLPPKHLERSSHDC